MQGLCEACKGRARGAQGRSRLPCLHQSRAPSLKVTHMHSRLLPALVQEESEASKQSRLHFCRVPSLKVTHMHSRLFSALVQEEFKASKDSRPDFYRAMGFFKQSPFSARALTATPMQEEYEASKESQPDFYRAGDSLQHGVAPKLPARNVELMVAELNQQRAKKQAYSRRHASPPHAAPGQCTPQARRRIVAGHDLSQAAEHGLRRWPRSVPSDCRLRGACCCRCAATWAASCMGLAALVRPWVSWVLAMP